MTASMWGKVLQVDNGATSEKEPKLEIAQIDMSLAVPKPPDGTRLAQAAYQGFLDIVTPFKLQGWAWLPGSPDERVIVEATIGGLVVARGSADQFRQDLEGL